MANIEAWEKATAELYQKQNLSNCHNMFSQLEIEPLSTADNSKVKSQWRSQPHVFYNITPYQDEIFDDEFIANPGCGVWINDEWPDKLSTKNAFIYLIASPGLTGFKKALLTEKRCFRMNAGIDPYSLGLWKAKLFKAEIDSQHFAAAFDQECALFRLTSQPYSLCGANDVQQLAILMASMVQLLNDYEGQQSHQEILQSLSFEVAMKPHLINGVSKLRALQSLLARLAELYKFEASSFPVFATPAARYLGSREPWNNILRMTSITAAAKMAGADGVVAYPYDIFLKKNRQGFRTSRNIAEVLELESFLGQVNDPLLGSYTVQDLEQQMIEKAWQFFVEIENKEGLRSVLRSGWLLDQIEVEAKLQEAAFAAGDWVITGVNDYPLSESLSAESPLPTESQCFNVEDWWVRQYTEGETQTLCDVARFVPVGLARYFESWQYRADRLREARGQAPEIPILVEDGPQSIAKLKNVTKALALGGLKAKRVKDLKEIHGPVVAIVASDPEGEFVKGLLESLAKSKVSVKLWVGTRIIPGFDYSIDMKVNLPYVYEKIFLALEDQ